MDERGAPNNYFALKLNSERPYSDGIFFARATKIHLE